MFLCHETHPEQNILSETLSYGGYVGRLLYEATARKPFYKTSVYSTQHLSSAEDKNFPFCPQLRTQKTYGKQMLLSKLSTMAYLTMVVLLSSQLLTQYYTN